MRSLYIAQAETQYSLEHTILLLQPLKCLEGRHVPSCPAKVGLHTSEWCPSFKVPFLCDAFSSFPSSCALQHPPAGEPGLCVKSLQPNLLRFSSFADSSPVSSPSLASVTCLLGNRSSLIFSHSPHPQQDDTALPLCVEPDYILMQLCEKLLWVFPGSGLPKVSADQGTWTDFFFLLLLSWE